MVNKNNNNIENLHFIIDSKDKSNSMKKYMLFFCFQLFLLSGYTQSNNKATISIDLSQNTEKISSLIFGQFIEYLGRCIDGGIYEEGSPLSNENGFRKDVLKNVQGLKIPHFPGEP